MNVFFEHNYFKPPNSTPRNNTFQCHICPSVFKQNAGLYNHLKRIHKVKNFGANKIKCREEKCSESFNWLAELEAHLYKNHMINIEKQKLSFGSLDEFKIWKREMEKETESEYVTYSSSSKSNIFYYKCSRSGVYKEQLSHGTRMRRLKSQGSKKSGFHCISRMIVRVNDSNGSISVNFCKTHYGHNVELAHLALSRTEKDKIAANLVQGVSINSILDGVRNSVTSNEIDRIHLLTRKDIKNIEKSYGLNMEIERHKNDLISVNAWIKEVEASGQSPVILHKNQGEAKLGFDNNDFLLGLMTHSQANMLMKFGKGGIVCMDGTHGTNPYNFTLVTLMVVDDFHEGFPVAFLYTNKEDTKSISEFLCAIRNITGQIDAAVFMSDDADQYSNSWTSVMGGCFKKLLCSWHVDRAWRKNLYLIKNKEKQAEVYKLLKIIQCETRSEVFDNLHVKFIKKLHIDTELHDFCKYYEKYYSQRTETWAYCRRVGCQINTNMFLESLHRVIKHVYMGGIKIRRLDRSVQLLMKLVKNKVFERIIKLHKGKASSKIADIEAKHRKAMKFPEGIIKNINSRMFNFTSQQDCSSEYIIEKVNPDLLVEHKCNLHCVSCDCCIHSYTCTCPDYLIKGSMCKHVHAVALYEKGNTVLIPAEPDRPQVKNNSEIDILARDVRRNSSDVLEKEKEEILSLLKCLTLRVRNEENIEKLNVVKKYLRCAESLSNLDSLCSPKESSQVLLEHPRKKIELQVKKTNTRKRKPDFAKPGNQVKKPCYFEKEELIESLLQN